jgi:uncharacterized protein (TIGR02996 family)
VRESLLDQALKSASRSDGEATLTCLLQAWRSAPAPQIAQRIHLLSERLGAAPVTGKNPTQALDAFIERTRVATEADIGPLMQNLREAFPVAQGHQLKARLQWVETREPDPRITRTLCDLLGKLGQARHVDERVLSKLAKALERHADDDSLDHVPERPANPLWRSDPLGSLRQRLGKRPASATTLSPAELASLNRLDEAIRVLEAPATRAQPRPRPTEALLAAVYADPADDELRRVAADALLEAGDPRGEFIHLQLRRAAGGLEPASERRERQLLKQHRDAWLGPLLPFVAKARVEFEKGFPAVLESTVNRVFKRKLAEALPQWATARVLTQASVALVLPQMKMLEAVEYAGDDTIDCLSTLEPAPPLRQLHLCPAEMLRGKGGRSWTWLEVLRRYPKLEELEIGLPYDQLAHWDDLAPMMRAIGDGLGPVCRRLVVSYSKWDARDPCDWWPAMIDATPPTVQRLEWSGIDYAGTWAEPHLVYLRGPSSRFDTLEIHLCDAAITTLTKQRGAAVLKVTAQNQLASITVLGRVSEAHAAAVGEIERLARAAGREVRRDVTLTR